MNSGDLVAARPRVLLVDAYPQAFSGSQRTMFDLATSMTIHEPVVLQVAAGEVGDRFQAAGVHTIVVPYPPRLTLYGGRHKRQSAFGKVLAALALVGYNLRVARAVRRSGAQVVYCSNTRSVLSAGLGARVAGARVVWYVQQLERSLGLADRVAGRLSDRVVTISSNIDRVFPKRLARRLKPKIRTVPLGIDTAAWSRLEPVRRDSTPVIAVVGSVTELKGVHLLLDAFALVRASQSARLVIVGGAMNQGDHAFADMLRLRAAEAGVADDIEWMGWRDDVGDILARSDILASASFREGLPRSMMEAMVMGVAVVATDVGAVSDLVIDGSTGLLVPPGDVRALAAALERLVVDSQLRRQLSLAGQRHVLASFDRDRWVDGFEVLFAEVVA